MKKLCLSLCLGLLLTRCAAARPSYDPLAVPVPAGTSTIDVTVHDAARGRDVPLLVYLPHARGAAPVVLFSHGLGGSRHGSAFLGRHWAARGYVAVFLQHPGSDDSVWKDVPAAQRLGALRAAASARNLMLRIGDVTATLDQLTRWNQDRSHALAGRLDMTRVGMSGHSFGAVTTQWVSGQSTRGAHTRDRRIKAAVIMSPSAPRVGNPATVFGQVDIPWMLMTGTHDTAPIGAADAASRRAVYPALPPGGKYELVLFDGEHSAFTDRALPGDSKPRNPNHHRVILALSTAFWDACLRHDAAAKAWLEGAGPRTVMQSGDSWQHK